MNKVVDLTQYRNAKQADQFADTLLTSSMEQNTEYSNSSLKYLIELTTKILVKIGSDFTQTLPRNVWQATSVMPYTLKVISEGLYRLDMDGSDYYYDLYVENPYGEDYLDQILHAIDVEMELNQITREKAGIEFQLSLLEAQGIEIHEDLKS